MPLGQASEFPRAVPKGRVNLRFRHRLIRFRHFCSGSLALASLDRACRDLVPAFPQRLPPRLLPAAACGGLRSVPDHRTRRALLHLSYSCAPHTNSCGARDTRPIPDLGRHLRDTSFLSLRRSVLAKVFMLPMSCAEPYRAGTFGKSATTPSAVVGGAIIASHKPV